MTTQKIIAKPDSWVKCPLCAEEWTKLKPCSYLNDENNPIVTNVCVRCAESVVMMERVLSIIGLKDQDSINITKFKQHPYDYLPDKYLNEKSYGAYLESIKPIVHFIVTVEDPRLKVFEQSTNSTQVFDNIFQVCSYFKRKLKEEETKKPIEPKKWGKPVKTGLFSLLLLVAH